MTKSLVVDSSALLAVFFGEPEQNDFLDLIFGADQRRISTFSILESGAVVFARKGPSGRLIFDSLCEELALEVVPFTAEQARFARQAWERFGKGKASSRVESRRLLLVRSGQDRRQPSPL